MEFYAVLLSNIVVIVIGINIGYLLHALFIFWRQDVNLIRALKFEMDSLEYDSVKAYSSEYTSNFSALMRFTSCLQNINDAWTK